MNSKRSSIIGKLGWWLTAEILVFTTVLLLTGYFAFSSFDNAFLSALILVIAIAMTVGLYNRIRTRTNR
jgi:hypothetical protein